MNLVVRNIPTLLCGSFSFCNVKYWHILSQNCSLNESKECDLTSGEWSVLASSPFELPWPHYPCPYQKGFEASTTGIFNVNKKTWEILWRLIFSYMLENCVIDFILNWDILSTCTNLNFAAQGISYDLVCYVEQYCLIKWTVSKSTHSQNKITENPTFLV